MPVIDLRLNRLLKSEIYYTNIFINQQELGYRICEMIQFSLENPVNDFIF